jgi:hypothetical protein
MTGRDSLRAVKDMLRPMPGTRQLSLLRQRLAFSGSAPFWEQRYQRGGTSGPGSYGALGAAKAEFLNGFVRNHGIESVIEFGCGDGHQLSLAEYPSYIGLDVSRSAIGRCRSRFAADRSKSFFLYDGACFADRAGLFTADLAVSLDVIYHLVEDAIFETYMTHLFLAGRRYVVLYSTNSVARDDAPHVRHRVFTSWVAASCPQWRLSQVTEGPDAGSRRADFYVFAREPGGAA